VEGVLGCGGASPLGEEWKSSTTRESAFGRAADTSRKGGVKTVLTAGFFGCSVAFCMLRFGVVDASSVVCRALI